MSEDRKTWRIVAMLDRLPKRRRRILLWSIGLLLFYTLFGFFGLPLIVRGVAAKQLSQQLNRVVTIDKIKINPYALSVAIRGLLIKDKDDQPFVSWDEVYVNLQLSSFFGKSWVFSEIRTTQPFVRVQMNKDYSLNFSDLVEKFSAPDPAAKSKPSKSLSLRVDLLRILGARAALTDLTPRTPFHRVVGPLEIDLTNFRTDPDNKNPYAFEGTTDSGEKFSWSGFFFLDPIRSEGSLSLEGISIPKYAALYQDLVRFDIKGGIIDIHSTYRFQKSATADIVAVTNTTFTLRDLKVTEKETTNEVANLGALSVRGVSADLAARTGEISSIDVTDGRLVVARAEDSSINVVQLSKPAETATNSPGGVLLLLRSVTNAFSLLLNSTNAWTGGIRNIHVTNCAVALTDRANSRPVDLLVDNIEFAASDLSNLPDAKPKVNCSLRWNTNGFFGSDASLQLNPPSAEIHIKAENLDLQPLGPYLEPFANVFITRSKLSVTADLRLRTTNDALPVVTFSGDARLDDFGTLDGVMSEDLLQWKSVAISGIEANLNPPTVAIKQIDIIEPHARVVIETNRTVNLLSVLKMGQTNSANISATPAKPASSKKTGALVRAALAPTTNSTGAAVLPKITVASIVLSNAHLDYLDRSVHPPAKAVIQDLSGTISGLSSEELKRADLAFRGKIGNSGPIEITGSINPLTKNSATELKVIFHDVDLSPTSPYMGQFLGYRLNRGRLNLDLKYDISERKLKARNLVVLDQFTLGEKVDSPDATKLPVKLAIAILKDRSGKIELDVPVEGSLDDPDFHLGKAITHVLVNIITKLVTSPFAALGALFGGAGEEVSFLEFSPGRIQLEEANLAKIQSLLKGLEERPGLQLEIEGGFDPTADADALRRQRLVKKFRNQKWSTLRKAEQARLTPDQVSLTPEEYNDLLQAAYATLPPAARAAPASVSAPVSEPGRAAVGEKGATTLLTQTKPVNDTRMGLGEIERQVLATIDVPEDDLRKLSKDRATQVQGKILESGKITADRISVLSDKTGPATNRTTRVYFHLN